MANFNLGLGPTVEIRSKSIIYQPTTTTPFINPIFEGVGDVYDPSVPINYTFNGLGNSVRIQTPGRPGGGQLYPRGNR